MREYTATPIDGWDAEKRPIIVVEADDLCQKEGSNIVVFALISNDGTYVGTASLPGNLYIIISKEIE